MHYLSVIAIFKNETMNLKVWLEHYLWQGVDHFYLIDNGSTDNPMEILQEYMDKGLVTYFYGARKHWQQQYYKDMFDREKLRDNTYWLVVCDIDEFYFGMKNKLRTELKSLEKYNLIYSCWHMFGSDGLLKQPPDIRTSITHREEQIIHKDSKYIFKTKAIPNSSHIWIHGLVNFYDDEKTLRDDSIIRLNHYVIQSLEFFQKIKMTRGAADFAEGEYLRNMNYFFEADKNATFEDVTLKNLITNPPEDY
uniref:Glycosyltransferase 2-like domain-containing protein n=1 Tax=viral metagenome TaxID=1070528 RepID=A0A6C0HB72_9ZZZZ